MRRKDDRQVASGKLQRLLLKTIERELKELRDAQREKERTSPHRRRKLERALLRQKREEPSAL